MPKPSPKPVRQFYEIRHPKKRAFLSAFSNCGVITQSAVAANIARDTYNDWLTNDPVFAKAMETARQNAIDGLEAEARRRAIEGDTDLVLHNGKPVIVNGKYVTRRKRSDVLLIVMMKRFGMFRDDGAVPVNTRQPMTADEVLNAWAAHSGVIPPERNTSEMPVNPSDNGHSTNGNGQH